MILNTISIHALRGEGDRCCRWCCGSQGYFYPRPPRGGRRCDRLRRRHRRCISIHALRGEGDERASRPRCGCPRFLSTPSAGRATLCQNAYPDIGDPFLSTPSAGRATLASPVGVHLQLVFLSTPSAGRATAISGGGLYLNDISIHALRGEGDRWSTAGARSSRHFYPRPPRGGRLRNPETEETIFCISIHALRGEGDLEERIHTVHKRNFYPRPPRGGRQGRKAFFSNSGDFYPRPPRGGRPGEYYISQHFRSISIHALRGEGDPLQRNGRRHCGDFYPRPPRGGRPKKQSSS